MSEQEQPADLPDSDAADAAASEHDQAAVNHDNQADEASQEQTEEDEEVEIGDKKFALPKSAAEKLKAERLMQADYTRKTQETAERNRTLDTREQSIAKQAEQQQQYIKEVAKVHALDDQLAEFEKVDWNALNQSDPVLAQQLDFQRRDLERKRNEATTAVTQKREQHALAEQQSTAKQVQEAEAYVQREIPGWTTELGAQINQFAQAQGVKMDQSFAKAVIANPALIKIMHDAKMFQQLKAKQATPPKPAPPPAPVTRVSAARASAAKDPAKMTDSEWAAWRAEKNRKR